MIPGPVLNDASCSSTNISRRHKERRSSLNDFCVFTFLLRQLCRTVTPSMNQSFGTHSKGWKGRGMAPRRPCVACRLVPRASLHAVPLPILNTSGQALSTFSIYEFRGRPLGLTRSDRTWTETAWCVGSASRQCATCLYSRRCR